MSRTHHPRGIAKKWSAHRRKLKEWKCDSVWKPGERDGIAEKYIRRSSRYRTADNSQSGHSLRAAIIRAEWQALVGEEPIEPPFELATVAA